MYIQLYPIISKNTTDLLHSGVSVTEKLQEAPIQRNKSIFCKTQKILINLQPCSIPNAPFRQSNALVTRRSSVQIRQVALIQIFAE